MDRKTGNLNSTTKNMNYLLFSVVMLSIALTLLICALMRGNRLRNTFKLLVLALGLTVGASGCTSALNSGHIVSVTERGFGIDIVTTSTANGTPQIKLGFFSSAVVLEPTVTNATLTAPNFANTFAIDQTASPFAFGVNETIASGSYQTGNVMDTNTAIASQPVVPK